MRILTTHGDLDETALMKREDVIDTDRERAVMVEYCLRDCPGPAHRTGTPDAPSYFCAQHVHRSVDLQLKQAAVFATGAVGGVG